MALSIKSDQADALARELSSLTGETLTTAVTEALRERVVRVRRTQALTTDVGAVLARLRAEAAALPILDDRSDDEIIGYDEYGLPA